MCWFIDVTLYNTDLNKANIIARKINQKQGLRTEAFMEKDSLNKGQSKLALLDDTGHCSCDIIVGDQELNGPKYMIEPTFVNRFVTTLEQIQDEVDSGFDIEICWAEDRNDVEKTISFKNLIELVKKGLIAADARFKVE